MCIKWPWDHNQYKYRPYRLFKSLRVQTIHSFSANSLKNSSCSSSSRIFHQSTMETAAPEGSSQSPEGISIPVLKNQLANLFLRPDLKFYPKPIDALLTTCRFAKALQLPILESKEIVIPTAEQLVDMFNEMGYEPQLSGIGSFKKSQTFLSLLYGVYYDVKVDFVSILWADFCSHINHLAKGTEIYNARFWAMVVHEQYQRTDFIYDPVLPGMQYSYITVSTVDENSNQFCAEIPHVMLAKVSLDNDVVNMYRTTLTMPYPTHPSAQAAITKVPSKSKGKKKVAGGPSSSKAVKKRKDADQPPMHGEEEEEEHQSEAMSDVRHPLFNIPSSGLDASLPYYPYQEGFGFESAFTTKPPTTDETFAAYHMAPITIEETDDENRDDGDFDPLKSTEGGVAEQLVEVKKALTEKVDEIVKGSEKRILD
ncbi:hypothetical protein L1887_31994 [Cichorium endivia]|nr:hypothetical protein L1887_31994 [Cichorium endivia]